MLAPCIDRGVLSRWIGFRVRVTSVKQQCDRREAAEKAKIELSSTRTEIDLPFITGGASGLNG